MTERMTAMETQFVRHMVDTNNATEAARRAGYSQPSSKGGVMMRKPAIVAEVQARLTHRLRTEGAEIGLGTLMEIAGDKSAPKAPRVMAAKVLVEMSGLVGGEAGTKDLHEMSRAELQASVDEARKYLAELEAPVIEGEVVPSGGVFD